VATNKCTKNQNVLGFFESLPELGKENDGENGPGVDLSDQVRKGVSTDLYNGRWDLGEGKELMQQVSEDTITT